MITRTQVLQDTHIALTNAQRDPSVSSTITAYGYDAARMEEGLMLYEKARLALQTQGDARSYKIISTKDAQELWKEVQRHYNHDLQLARMVFKRNSEGHAALQLGEKRPLTLAAWSTRVREFYRRLSTNSEWRAKVGAYGLTQARVEKGLELLQDLENAVAQRQAEVGNSSLTLRQRDQAFNELQGWMSNFRKVVRLSLSSQPETMASLGIKPIRHKQKRKEGQPVLPAATVGNQ